MSGDDDDRDRGDDDDDRDRGDDDDDLDRGDDDDDRDTSHSASLPLSPLSLSALICGPQAGERM